MRHVPDSVVPSRLALLCAAAFAAGCACGGPLDEAAPEPGVAAQAALEAEALSSGGGGHALPVSVGPQTEARRTGKLVYYGGRVLENARVVAVFWGDAVAPEVKEGMGDFYRAALNSSYVDWLSEYDTDIRAADGSPGTGQHIGRGALEKAVVIRPRSHKAIVSDAEVRRELTAQVTAHKLPSPGPNTLYMVHFPPGVQIELGGARSCRAGGFCAYHNSFRRGGKEVDYGVLPDLGPGSGCETGCGGAGKVFDKQTAVASHELVEAITDPAVGLGRGLAAPLAWYDAEGGEIGDLCNAQTGQLRSSSGRSYAVQKEWSNKAGACVLSGGRGRQPEAAWVEESAQAGDGLATAARRH